MEVWNDLKVFNRRNYTDFVQFISILDGTGTFGCGTASESKTIGCTELMSKKTCYCEADLCNGAQKNFAWIGLLIPLGVMTIIITFE